MSYKKPDWSLSYLTTKDDAEIDLIIERPGESYVAIEIKSTFPTAMINDPSICTNAA